MDLYDREYVSAVINYFWGEGLTSPHTVNETAALVAYEALEQANICSDPMDLLPRPRYSVVNAKYVLKELRKIGKRVLSGDTAIYQSCKAAISAKHKTEISMALMGI
ncbi:MAG: hypothetical protein SVU69_11675 [Pseudomonadota bacterium]|nr:hypothetical protein [Pseudomonadota bacterium]